MANHYEDLVQCTRDLESAFFLKEDQKLIAKLREMRKLEETKQNLSEVSGIKNDRILQKLVDLGNTVVIIEHNLEVIKTADWILDLGPEGGEKGGRLVAAGTPEKVARVKKSHTGSYLQRIV